MRALFGRGLRALADIIDNGHAPEPTGASFTFEAGEGFTVRTDGRGTPLWYLGDHARVWAYTHADRPVGRPWTDWRGKPLPERQIRESLRLNGKDGARHGD